MIHKKEYLVQFEMPIINKWQIYSYHSSRRMAFRQIFKKLRRRTRAGRSWRIIEFNRELKTYIVIFEAKTKFEEIDIYDVTYGDVNITRKEQE